MYADGVAKGAGQGYRDAPRSELIRRAVRRAYGGPSTARRLRALEAGAGSWTSRECTGSEYLEALRGDLSDRLRRLAMK